MVCIRKGLSASSESTKNYLPKPRPQNQDGEMSAPVQQENITPTPDLDQLCINTIRTLSLDAVQKAESGHPGLPLGAAPMAYVLWTRFLRHNPKNPKWENRDR